MMEINNETMMDNNVAEEAMATVAEVTNNTYGYKNLAIAGGTALGLGGLYLLVTKVIVPAVKQHKNRKELEAAKTQAEAEETEV